MRRWIMHVDMDAFFASIEQRDHPEWQGKPVIVGGLSRRGVVATASYEARKYGVHSAMPMEKAKKLCPDGIFTTPRFEVYRAVSREIREIMSHYASAVEPVSIDEAFMDITGMGSKFPTLGAIGRAVRKEIRDKTGLTASAGIAPNKFLAKMASEMGKPDGLFIIPYGKEKEILAPLPVRRLWGVGKVSEKKLTEAGYRLIGDVQRSSPEKLEKILGSQGRVIYRLASGIDGEPLHTQRQAKSIGAETTYETDLTDPKEIDRQIAIYSDIVASRLRKHHLQARTISLKIRFASFTTVTRSMSLPEGTDLEEEIDEAAHRLLKKIPIHEGIRLIGITGSHLTEPVHMASLFSDTREKRARAARVMDELQQKYGPQALRKGFWLEEKEARQKEQSEKKESHKGGHQHD